MTFLAIVTRVAVLAVLVAGCAQATPSEVPAAEQTSPAASASEGVSDGSESIAPSHSPLPTGLGPPQPIQAGTYLTPEGFDPAVSITVPDGWYGAAGESGFAVGKGLTEDGEFAEAGIYVAPIPVPYDEAITIFEELEGVEFSEPPSTVELDGREATVFHGSPVGDQVLLDDLLPGIDLNAAAHQQIFVDVDGQALLIRTELHSDDAEGELADVISSLAFP